MTLHKYDRLTHSGNCWVGYIISKPFFVMTAFWYQCCWCLCLESRNHNVNCTKKFIYFLNENKGLLSIKSVNIFLILQHINNRIENLMCSNGWPPKIKNFNLNVTLLYVLQALYVITQPIVAVKVLTSQNIISPKLTCIWWEI